MSEVYRAAIIGTGGIAGSHAHYFKSSDRAELVAVCDISEERVNAFADQRGIEHRYTDYERLLNETGPDIVSVCTWTRTHMPISMAAMESGAQAIIAEKPMSDELGSPMDAVALAQERGCCFVVHHKSRFAPGYCAARGLVSEGAIGAPVSIHMRIGGGLLNIGSHTVDAARWLFGDPAWEYVCGWIQRDTDRFERGSYCEEKALALMRFAGGAELVLSVDMVDGRGSKERQLVGPEGVISFNREQAVLIDAHGIHEPRTDPQPDYFDELIAWMEGGPAHRQSAVQALATEQLLMAIFESARVRSRIEPPYEKRESPLAEMIESGMLPAAGEPYDIRNPAALG